MDPAGTQGFWKVPSRGPSGHPGRFDHCGRGRQGRHREADARDGIGRFEIALPFRGDAYRVVYAVQLAEDIWVVHAFQKKSPQGIKTSKQDLELIKTG